MIGIPRSRRVKRAVTALLVVAGLTSAGLAAAVPGFLNWTDRFHFGFDDFFNDLDTDGKIVVSLTTENWIVRAHDPISGALEWQDGPLGSQQLGRDMLIDGRRVFTAGQRQTPATGFDFGIRANKAGNGALLWEDPGDLSGGLHDDAVAIDTDRSSLFAAGYSSNLSAPCCVRDFIVRAYRQSNGLLLWEDRFIPGLDSTARDIAAGGGRVFAVGEVGFWPGPASDAVIRAYDGGSGALLWQHKFNHFGLGTGAAQVVLSGNRVLVSSRPNTASSPGRITSYDAATGALQWLKYVGPNIRQIATDGSRVYAAWGETTGATGLDWIIAAHDISTGAELWRDVFDLGGGDDSAFAVTARDGMVFVAGTGQTLLPTDLRLIVRAYDAATAALLWSDTQDFEFGPFSERARRIVAAKVRGRIRVYVGGTTFNSGAFDTDAVLLGYDAE